MLDRVVTLIVRLVLVLFLLQWGFAIARGVLGAVGESVAATPLASAGAVLFAAGIVVRLGRWMRAKGAEGARRRRAEQWNTVTGSPERLAGPTAAAGQRAEPGLRRRNPSSEA